jgi:Carboxypeptidase regulatory-like domain
VNRVRPIAHEGLGIKYVALILLAFSALAGATQVCAGTAPPRVLFLQSQVTNCGDALNAAPGTAAEPQGRILRSRATSTAGLQGVVRDASGRGIAGASVSLRNLESGKVCPATTNGDGIFRMLAVPAGRYELKVASAGFEDFTEAEISLAAGAAVSRELNLKPIPGATPPGVPPRIAAQPELGNPSPAPPPVESAPPTSPALGRQPEVEVPVETPSIPPLPRADQVFKPQPDRWDVQMPKWDRYGRGGEVPYVKGRWWDPFDRNKLKGDQPIIGQRVFLNVSASSDTFFDGRCLPTPSNVSAAQPGSSAFFGRCQQAFLTQTFRFTFDLFRGDASFRPVDWRIRITPAVNVNYLDVRELGVVNIDVRQGTTRLDSHFGLQEAFAEVKLHDLSNNFDFVSVRAGIQDFNSDFRGFIFVDEQPAVRVFGNLDSNRYEYNLAYFHQLEKDTNSDLNSFERRHQQVIIANLYRQDFLFKGYTAQFSVHYDKDDATFHFDKNDFLVRPAPIGVFQPHSVHAVYLGWTGNGHIGDINVSHAFYEALGNDSLNPLAGRPVTIDAQMAALELSVDKDWVRYKTSVFYASGDGDARGGRARGFDSIDDFPEFAGGIFSLWNREGIKLTGSGVLLTTPDSLLPSLRSSKEEGQANFVNPGILLVNAGANFEVTPKLRSFVNVNYLRFERTEPLEVLLFQESIHHSIGWDYSVGFRYRPPLTENIILTGGVSGLTPGQGFHDIYTGRTLFSIFGDLRFVF